MSVFEHIRKNDAKKKQKRCVVEILTVAWRLFDT